MKIPKKIGTVKTVDMATGEVKEVKHNAMTLLPPAGDVCQVCATEHEWDRPHNQESLYYQMQFHAEHGRYPTWTDSMRHCTPEVQAMWRMVLVETMRAKDMEIPADLLGEAKPAGR